MPELLINGQVETSDAATVALLLAARGLAERKSIAVAVNGRVVHRSAWATTKLDAHDAVEIIEALVGG